MWTIQAVKLYWSIFAVIVIQSTDSVYADLEDCELDNGLCGNCDE